MFFKGLCWIIGMWFKPIINNFKNFEENLLIIDLFSAWQKCLKYSVNWLNFFDSWHQIVVIDLGVWVLKSTDAMYPYISRRNHQLNSHSLVLTVKITLLLDLINSSRMRPICSMFSSFGMAKKSTVSIIRRGSTFDLDVNFWMIRCSSKMYQIWNQSIEFQRRIDPICSLNEDWPFSALWNSEYIKRGRVSFLTSSRKYLLICWLQSIFQKTHARVSSIQAVSFSPPPFSVQPSYVVWIL